MIDSTLLEATWGSISLATDDEGGLIITRKGTKDGPNGVMMVAYKPKKSLLRIFPRKSEWDGADDAYQQLKEIRLDLDVTDWDPADPVHETEQGDFRLVGLPDGLGVIISYGLAFPRNYKKLIHEFESQTKCKVLYLTHRNTVVTHDILQLNIADFNSYIKTTDLHRRRAGDVASRLNGIEAFNTIARASNLTPREASPARLPLIRAMSDVISGKTDLDTPGRDELLLEVIAETRAAAHANAATLGRLRQDVNLVTLEVLIERFEAALQNVGRKSERTWQSFFSDNPFALQQMFSSPVTYVGEQIEVKIPTLHGSGLRRPDFLMVNTVSRVAHLIEIKTPSSKLMQKSPYRGADGAEVYACDGELAGTLAQLQAQVQSARTDLALILKNTLNAPTVDTGIVRGVAIAGTFDALSPQQRQSFLRYREGLVGIDILTYDEVLERLRGLHTVLSQTQRSDATTPLDTETTG